MLNIDDLISVTGLFQAAREMKLTTSPGVDGVCLEMFRNGLKDTPLAHELIKQLKSGTYKPQALEGALIPKPNGTKREIAIPTVQDRVIQRMLVRALTERTEARFSEQSYGFRPKRNVQQAVQEASRITRNGYKTCVLVDLKNFFGNIDRERMRKLLRDYALDETTRELINKFIKAPVLKSGKITRTDNGVPAGTPIAPLLANIYLHPLDMALERKQIQFVRYADDLTLFFKGKEDYQNFLALLSDGSWSGCEQRYGIVINYDKIQMITEGKRPILGFQIDDDGRVTFSPKVLNDLLVSLTGLLHRPPTSDLTQLTAKVRGALQSIIGFYKVAEDRDQVITACNSFLDKVRPLLMNHYNVLELVLSAGHELQRIDDVDEFSIEEVVEKLLPPLERKEGGSFCKSKSA